MASEKMEVNGVEIDVQKAQRMLQRIIVREKLTSKQSSSMIPRWQRKLKR